MAIRSLVPMKISFLAFSILLAGCSKENKPAAKAADEHSEAAKGLSVGDLAPDFSATTHSGKHITLSDYRGKVVVVYFYPMDDTPGCTAEAKGFRDAYESYQKRDAVVLGISTQGNDSHQEFAKEYGLPFHLIADEDGEIADNYDAKSFLGLANRKTFIVDREGKVAKVYADVSPENHAKEVLADVDRLLEATSKP